MTDRLNGVFVVFDRDFRVDDAEPLINAIKQLRGVASVEWNVTDPADVVATVRARYELGEKLMKALYPELPK